MPLMIGCPNVSGAGLGLGAAKLTIASKAPTEQRVKAMKARGLKRPDCEEGFFFMRFSFVSLQRRLSLTLRKLRHDRMLFFQVTQHQPTKSSARRCFFRTFQFSHEPAVLTSSRTERDCTRKQPFYSPRVSVMLPGR